LKILSKTRQISKHRVSERKNVDDYEIWSIMASSWWSENLKTFERVYVVQATSFHFHQRV